MKYLIETLNLTRNFGNIIAVEDLNLTIRDGEVFGFIGPNGAGKTTTIRMLCCLIAPTSGTAFLNGLDITDPDDALKIRGMIGLLPESPGLYESLSAYRNLDFFAHLYGVPKSDREKKIRELLIKLDVWDRRDDPVAKFSKGMKQKIAIARALVHEPDFLFLDEPTSGLDPLAAVTVRNYLVELKKEGRTIFINTHNLDDAEKICDRVGIIQRKLLATGSAEDLASRLWGKTTRIQLKTITPQLIEAVKRLRSVRSVRWDDKTLMIDVENPEEDNPIIVRSLIEAGGEIEFVEEMRRGLEDIYLKLIGGSR